MNEMMCKKLNMRRDKPLRCSHIHRAGGPMLPQIMTRPNEYMIEEVIPMFVPCGFKTVTRMHIPGD